MVRCFSFMNKKINHKTKSELYPVKCKITQLYIPTHTPLPHIRINIWLPRSKYYIFVHIPQFHTATYILFPRSHTFFFLHTHFLAYTCCHKTTNSYKYLTVMQLYILYIPVATKLHKTPLWCIFTFPTYTHCHAATHSNI